MSDWYLERVVGNFLIRPMVNPVRDFRKSIISLRPRSARCRTEKGRPFDTISLRSIYSGRLLLMDLGILSSAELPWKGVSKHVSKGEPRNLLISFLARRLHFDYPLDWARGSLPSISLRTEQDRLAALSEPFVKPSVQGKLSRRGALRFRYAHSGQALRYSLLWSATQDRRGNLPNE